MQQNLQMLPAETIEIEMEPQDIIVESQALAHATPTDERALVVASETVYTTPPPPQIVLQRLADAINCLMSVINAKPPEERKRWIATIEGQEYFTLLSLQFIGAFFHLGVGVDRYEEIRDPETHHVIGFRCHARVVDAKGRIWSEAWGEASRKELVPEYEEVNGKRRRTGNYVPRWPPNKPDQWVFSMAQTRAMRKALVAMLAPALALKGYGMEAAEDKLEEKETVAAPAEEPKAPAPDITPKDWAWFWQSVRKLGYSAEQVHEFFGVKSLREIITNRRQLENALDALKEAKA